MSGGAPKDWTWAGSAVSRTSEVDSQIQSVHAALHPVSCSILERFAEPERLFQCVVLAKALQRAELVHLS